MVGHQALSIDPFELIFALHAAEGHKMVLIVVVCIAVAHEAFAELPIRSVMHTQFFLFLRLFPVDEVEDRRGKAGL